MAKVSKFLANYTPRAKNHDERCALCKYFQKPDGCERVVGDISPQGWCRYFKREE